MTAVAVSDHARDRLHERLGLPKRAACRWAEQAFDRGRRPEQARPALALYLRAQAASEAGAARVVVVHHGVCAVFSEAVLVTLYPVPDELRRLA